MGLWTLCTDGGSCALLETDGFSAGQWASLQVVRVLCILNVVSTFLAMWCTSSVVQGTASLLQLYGGIWTYSISIVLSFLSMAIYIRNLQLPGTIKYNYGMAFVILDWLVWFPLCIIFLRCTLRTPKYAALVKQTKERRKVIVVSPGKAAAFAHFEAGSPSSVAVSQVTDIGAITEQRLGSDSHHHHHQQHHRPDRREARGEWVDEDHVAVRPIKVGQAPTPAAPRQ